MRSTETIIGTEESGVSREGVRDWRPIDWRPNLLLGAVSLLALTIVTGCTPTQITTDASNVQAVLNAAAPVVNAAACDAQKAANTATDVLLASGNSGDASTSASASKLLGLLCFTTVAAVPAAAK